jgi:hypothetical protein
VGARDGVAAPPPAALPQGVFRHGAAGPLDTMANSVSTGTDCVVWPDGCQGGLDRSDTVSVHGSGGETSGGETGQKGRESGDGRDSRRCPGSRRQRRCRRGSGGSGSWGCEESGRRGWCGHQGGCGGLSGRPCLSWRPWGGVAPPSSSGDSALARQHRGPSTGTLTGRAGPGGLGSSCSASRRHVDPGRPGPRRLSAGRP